MSGRCEWSDSDTRALISVWGDVSIQKQLDGTVRDSKVYQQIADTLSTMGIQRSAGQITGKIKALKKSYKQEKDRRGVSGSGSKGKFAFFSPMDEILGCKENTDPTFLLESCLSGEFVARNVDTTSEEDPIDFTISFPESVLQSSNLLESPRPSESCRQADVLIPGPAASSSEGSPCGNQGPRSCNQGQGTPSTSQGTPQTSQAADQIPLRNSKTSRTWGSKRKRTSLKEFIRTTVDSTVQTFIELEREMDQKNSDENRKFREELLSIEREKLNVLRELTKK